MQAPKLGIAAVAGALKQAGVKPDQVEDVYMGNVLSAGMGQAPARQVVLGVGCPPTTEATTINKVCASGMKSVRAAPRGTLTSAGP